MEEKKKSLELVLEDILDLEELDVNLFRGRTPESSLPRIFGGQTISQSLVAAYRTVDPHLVVHSLHAYFLRAGNPKLPLIYRVARIRNGRSFATRQVAVTQSGEVIFSSIISFHVLESGWEHQEPMPSVPSPDALPSRKDIFKTYLKGQNSVPKSMQAYIAGAIKIPFPLEIRPVESDFLDSAWKRTKLPPTQMTWIKAAGQLSDDPRIHQCVAAYMSDVSLMSTALRPHGKSFARGDVQGASVDHAMWFHHPFRADEFLLYECTSPQSAHALGLNFGRFYNQDGKLVISTAQEGLIRPVDKAKGRKAAKASRSRIFTSPKQMVEVPSRSDDGHPSAPVSEPVEGEFTRAKL